MSSWRGCRHAERLTTEPAVSTSHPFTAPAADGRDSVQADRQLGGAHLGAFWIQAVFPVDHCHSTLLSCHSSLPAAHACCARPLGSLPLPKQVQNPRGKGHQRHLGSYLTAEDAA